MRRRRGPAVLIVLVLVALLGYGSTRGRSLPLGIHTLRADDALLRRVQDLGAQYVVQVFAWREIEPTQGEYHWEYTDWLLRAADHYGLHVIARLDQPPDWGISESGAMPIRAADYASFARRVAARYRGRIPAYIIWNEPNLATEWAGRVPDPVAFTTLLKTASASVRAADANALILSAGLAPTNEHSANALDDRDFLRAMYAAGARDAFDILAAHPYPFALPPDDLRGAHGDLNLNRLQDLRELMRAQGDDAKPIWITEFGYTTETSEANASLRVSEKDQAQFIARAFALVREQMPFVQLFTVWNLTNESPAKNEQAGYSLIHPDGSQKSAYVQVRSLEQASPAAELARRVTVLLNDSAPATTFSVLAPDSVVHLGDSEYPAPWVPLYRDRNPSTEWTGEFYLREADLRHAPNRQWRLTMEVMQVNDFDTQVLVNGQAVTPPYLPTEDFTGIWVSAGFRIPGNLLHAGRNTVTLRGGKLFPSFQQLGFTWDDFQVRNVLLRAPLGSEP